MKTFEFTEEQIKMLAKCIEHRQCYLEETNRVYREMREKKIWGNDIVKYYNDNYEQIVCLQTLLDYINS